MNSIPSHLPNRASAVMPRVPLINKIRIGPWNFFRASMTDSRPSAAKFSSWILFLQFSVFITSYARKRNNKRLIFDPSLLRNQQRFKLLKCSIALKANGSVRTVRIAISMVTLLLLAIRFMTFQISHQRNLNHSHLLPLINSQAHNTKNSYLS